MAAKLERIYIGGLDPSRGLNVELVSSRLCSVKGVEILSINDVAITTDAKSKKEKQQKIMYNPKNTVVDEDGDVVDTRNFFYIEARSTSNISVEKTPNVEVDDNKPSISQPSAFDLLAKQYNSVKWKGCQLRVETAKPHFLKRLEGERADQLEKQRKMEQAEEEARKLMPIDDNADDGGDTDDAPKEDADGEQEQPTTATTTPKKTRRRLRIRKRFGEEAYHVDTLPHPLRLHSQKEDAFGWEEFAHLNKKLKRKRSSQQLKLVERRKKERRLWASGKGTGKVPPKMEAGGGNGEDHLNALIFLNRGIHVRFSDEDAVAAVERGGAVVPPLQYGTILGEGNNGDEPVEQDDGVVEDYASATSSSVVSSSDDSEDSSDSEIDTKEGSKMAYAWSDDDKSEAGSDENAESMDDANNHPGAKKETYSWSDDDGEAANNKVQSDSDDRSTDSEDSAKINPKEAKRLMVGSSSAAYTKAAAMDEFSGGMDFGTNDDPDTFVEWRDASDSGIDDNDNDDASSDEDETEYIAEDDIKSNMGILSKMFPGERFGQVTAVASIVDKKGNDNTEDGDNKPIAANELGKRQNASSMFGAGLIMQRYDPLKEADKKFEVSQAGKATEKVKEETTAPVEEGMDKDEGEDKEEDGSLKGDASASSESSDEEDEASKDHDKDTEEHASESSEESEDEKPTSNTNNKKTKAPSNHEGKDVPAKDIYEQDKLEQVFKQARGGQSESFSLANLLQQQVGGKVDEKEEQAEQRGDVYEQDKLENVFKQARGADGSSTNASAGGGFTFGFQSQPQTDDKAGDGFSFGFDLGNAPKAEDKEGAAAVEQGQKKHLDAGESATNQSSMTKTTSEPKKASNQRKRRVGMMAFPESDLDKYENMFFSLNEGPQILKDLDAMKQNEENQEKWQKERLVLTADWKRKQKSASSRKPKKVRR